ncbi:hypothetical protein ACFY2M_45990, partial [Streptomyces sp. NPDC001276]|uniref:hypothetical protein n=1 Tax=Streptomyces sp. NPDC001276 TaxID=3364555 RepID=UPI0036973987
MSTAADGLGEGEAEGAAEGDEDAGAVVDDVAPWVAEGESAAESGWKRRYPAVARAAAASPEIAAVRERESRL